MRSLSKCSIAALLLCGGAFADAPAGSGVDIAWKVLPRRVVADNFGARVAKLYFAVQAVVGNSSGYDIQVSSIFFRMPDAAGLSAPVPTDPYTIVRGTLDREHLVGLRNTSIHIIEAVGPMLAGGAVFFAGNTAASLHHGLIYSRIIDLFTGPFAKGFGLVFPDKTLNQMVVVSRDLLMTDDASAEAKARRHALRRGLRSDFDPLVVMRQLGEIVLVGKSVQYVNRINITAGAAGKHPLRPAGAIIGQDDVPCAIQTQYTLEK